MAWNIRAQMIESCSCNMLCPCWFGVKDLMLMDRGWCDGSHVFRIQSGKSDGVDLGGRTVVMAVDFPGPTILDGAGTARLYIDKAASTDQYRELEAIFQGKKGGPMEILASFVSRWLPTKTAEIAIRDEGDAIKVDVANFGSVESRVLKNEAGDVMTLQNAGFAAILQFENLKADLAPSGSHWRDPEMPRHFETKSGARAMCNWNVK